MIKEPQNQLLIQIWAYKHNNCCALGLAVFEFDHLKVRFPTKKKNYFIILCIHIYIFLLTYKNQTDIQN